ncbi:MAG: hypothetical protein QOJ09_2381 [Actinomycetota bacterium]|nr:hypothetical protein [Actinomycetota bacterium]
MLLGFLAAVALRARPPSPEARLPGRYRLAALIERQQTSATRLRHEVDDLRRQVDALVAEAGSRQAGATARTGRLDRATLTAGLVSLRGPGVKVTLDDSLLDEAPTGNVNDLVIHSQDVQATVNALWRSGAEAVAINGQRLVGTSAVLCVGNTLLLNGTVHSPPYVIAAIGAQKDRFDLDPLVRRLRGDADAFGIRFSVSRADALDVPAYKGSTALRYARPVG